MWGKQTLGAECPFDTVSYLPWQIQTAGRTFYWKLLVSHGSAVAFARTGSWVCADHRRFVTLCLGWIVAIKGKKQYKQNTINYSILKVALKNRKAKVNVEWEEGGKQFAFRSLTNASWSCVRAS